MIPVGKFIVPDQGDKVDYGIGLSYLPVRLHTVGWRAGRTTRANFILPVRDYEFG